MTPDGILILFLTIILFVVFLTPLVIWGFAIYKKSWQLFWVGILALFFAVASFYLVFAVFAARVMQGPIGGAAI